MKIPCCLLFFFLFVCLFDSFIHSFRSKNIFNWPWSYLSFKLIIFMFIQIFFPYFFFFCSERKRKTGLDILSFIKWATTNIFPFMAKTNIFFASSQQKICIKTMCHEIKIRICILFVVRQWLSFFHVAIYNFKCAMK